MSAVETLPTREGFPEGSIGHYREQAHIAQARALGAAIAYVFRWLRDLRVMPGAAELRRDSFSR